VAGLRGLRRDVRRGRAALLLHLRRAAVRRAALRDGRPRSAPPSSTRASGSRADVDRSGVWRFREAVRDLPVEALVTIPKARPASMPGPRCRRGRDRAAPLQARGREPDGIVQGPRDGGGASPRPCAWGRAPWPARPPATRARRWPPTPPRSAGPPSCSCPRARWRWARWRRPSPTARAAWPCAATSTPPCAWSRSPASGSASTS
jgi:hypothetical protein